MKEKKGSEFSIFVPFVLFLILCILVAGIKIIKEFKKELKEKKIETTQPSEEFKPEISKEIIGKVAIIIDDIGWNIDIVKEIEKINQPLTLSILPKAPYSKQVVEELKNKNYELLLHIPLEPTPPSQCLDKGLIKVNMDDEEIKRIFEDDVKDFLPYIKGVNNHMGSLYTANEEKMKVLLESIKEKNLFFIDSLTNPKSYGYKIAKEMRIKTGKRDIFLDISTNPEEINEKIDQLLNLAKEKGEAIAIGHAKNHTIKILKERIPEFEKEGIKIVPASVLLD